MKTITLTKLEHLAAVWCPPLASYATFIYNGRWGAAHELGHALVEPARRRRRLGYGRCSVGDCRCAGERCYWTEAAAMLVSNALLTASGRKDLVGSEAEDTPTYEKVNAYSSKGEAILKRLRLWPVPTRARALVRELTRRGLVAHEPIPRPRYLTA